MKKILFILLLSSCGNKKEEPKPVRVDTVTIITNTVSGDGNTIINGDTTVEY